ncbi:hypothetical protein [Corynebacterium sp. J010B-136]|nr:hypothetical protein [Corynebacterium sp. J010B-136]
MKNVGSVSEAPSTRRRVTPEATPTPALVIPQRGPPTTRGVSPMIASTMR